MSLNDIFMRVSTWNERRYDRDYNMPLTVNLLDEELGEWFESIEEVHKLDALCDVVYVALGAMWKLNLDKDTLINAQLIAGDMTRDLVNANAIMPIYLVKPFILALEHETDLPEEVSLAVMVNLCFVQMQSMGLSLEQCYKALSVVCDSNDSKSIKKTASDVKANTDKGSFFVAPEPRLQGVLNERHN